MHFARNPHRLPTKVCPVCGREFTWRKKWESQWDQIRYCSDKCRTHKNTQNTLTGLAEANRLGEKR